MTRVYIVDDHCIVRDGLRAMLRQGGHEVVGETDDPTVALGELQRLEANVLLLDLDLGGRSGLELLRALQRRGAPVRTLMLTMSVNPRDVAAAMTLGAAGYVLKDSSVADLLAAIDAVVRGQLHLGPGVAALAAEALSASRLPDPLAVLSPREQQIVKMVVHGASSAAIGKELHLSPKTVDTYRSRLMAKLGVENVAGLVHLAVRTGLVDAERG